MGLIRPLLSLNPLFMERLGSSLTSGGAAAVLPIEAAVTGGASVQAGRRSGWLEFQHVFSEEALVAWFWLFGVETLKNKLGVNQFPEWSHRLLKNFLPGLKKASLELTPLQQHAPYYQDAMTLLKKKSVGWLVAVSLPIALTGFIIPRLNQMKTEALVKWAHRKHLNKPIKPPSVGLLTPAKLSTNNPHRQAASFSVMMPYPSFTPVPFPLSAYPSYPYLPYGSNRFAQSLPFSPQPSLNPPMSGSGPRFGLAALPQVGLSWVASMVDGSKVGPLLVQDVPIIGGRVATTMSFSPWSALEGALRDLTRLEFYLLAIPQVMGLAAMGLTKLANSDLGKVLHTDTQISGYLNQQIFHYARSAKTPLTQKELLQFIHGMDTQHLGDLRKTVKQSIGSVNKQQLLLHLEKELEAHGHGALYQTLLKALPNETTHLTADQVESVLNKLWNNQLGLSLLKGRADHALKYEIDTVIKTAYSHAGGISWEQFNQALLKNGLNPTERQSIQAAFKEAAQTDATRVVASMLRRGMEIIRHNSLLKDSLTGPKPPAFKRGQYGSPEVLTRIIERSLLESYSLENYVSKSLGRLVSECEAFLVSHPQKEPKLVQALKKLKPMLIRGTPWSKEAFLAVADQIQVLGHQHKTLLGGNAFQALLDDIDLLEPLLSEKAIQGLSLQEILPHVARKLLPDILSQHHVAQPAVHQLLATYQQEIESLLSGQALRVFRPISSTQLSESKSLTAQLEREVSSILGGGLKNGSRSVQQAMRLLNWLPTDSTQLPLASNIKQAQRGVENYLHVLAERLSQHTGPLTQEVLEKTATVLKKQAGQARFLSYGLGLTFAITGMVFIVPALQFFTSYKITGKNEAPWLDAVTERLEKKLEAPKAGSNQYFN
jgi:hypothetical protein